MFLPSHKRRIGYVFQEPRLFPHLSVRHNLKYGAWFTPAGERHDDFDRVVALLGIDRLLDRAPDASVGRREAAHRPRPGAARQPAAAADGRAARLARPGAQGGDHALYRAARDESRIPIVYVSHSVAEVTRLATDMVVMADGGVVAAGPTQEIMQRLDVLPVDDRGEAGVLLDTVIESFDSAYGLSVLRSPAGRFRIADRLGDDGAPVRLRIRARDVIVATEPPRNSSALNVLKGRISGIGDAAGPLVEVRIDCSGQPHPRPHHASIAGQPRTGPWPRCLRHRQIGVLRSREPRQDRAG